MKKLLLFALIIAGLSACKKDNTTTPETTTTSAVNVYAIDTVRIHKQNIDGSGARQLIAKAQTGSKSAFIADMSADNPVSKIAYWLRTGTPGSYVSELRIAAADGSNDKLVKSISQNSVFPGIVKIGNNGIIYYTFNDGTSQLSQLYKIKEDGTGEVKLSSSIVNITDISADGKYTAAVYSQGGPTNLVYFDITGDGGAGSIKYSESSTPTIRQARISADGKKMLAIYTDGTALKCRVIDLATKTKSDVTIAATIPADVFNFFISLAPDNDQVICVASGSNSSTSYIYTQSTGKVTAQFNNINKGVYQAYLF